MFHFHFYYAPPGTRESPALLVGTQAYKAPAFFTAAALVNDETAP